MEKGKKLKRKSVDLDEETCELLSKIKKITSISVKRLVRDAVIEKYSGMKSYVKKIKEVDQK